MDSGYYVLLGLFVIFYSLGAFGLYVALDMARLTGDVVDKYNKKDQERADAIDFFVANPTLTFFVWWVFVIIMLLDKRCKIGIADPAVKKELGKIKLEDVEK